MPTLLDSLVAQIPDEDRDLFALCDEIGDRISAAMAAKGWTQRQLAASLGKQESYVSRALAGGVNFTVRTIIQFERALEVRLVSRDERQEVNEDATAFAGGTVLHTPGATLRLVRGASVRSPQKLEVSSATYTATTSRVTPEVGPRREELVAA